MVKLFSEVLGKEIEVPDEPQRIVSLAPAITETLYAIGYGDRVVGVSFFCDKPPEVSRKPRVGAYLNVNYQLLEKLKPDLILVTTGAQRGRIGELESRGYTVYPIPLPVSIYGILDLVVVVGLVVGELRRSRELASLLLDRLRPLRGALEGVKLYYEVDLGGPVSAGANSYIGDAIKFLGASHPFENRREAYVINPDPEVIRSFDPDVVVYEQKMGENATVAKIKRKFEARGLGDLSAVRNGRIVVMEYDSLAHYGPSFFASLALMTERVNSVLQQRQA